MIKSKSYFRSNEFIAREAPWGPFSKSELKKALVEVLRRTHSQKDERLERIQLFFVSEIHWTILVLVSFTPSAK
jgi:hypothetical protein